MFPWSHIMSVTSTTPTTVKGVCGRIMNRYPSVQPMKTGLISARYHRPSTLWQPLSGKMSWPNGAAIYRSPGKLGSPRPYVILSFHILVLINYSSITLTHAHTHTPTHTPLYTHTRTRTHTHTHTDTHSYCRVITHL